MADTQEEKTTETQEVHISTSETPAEDATKEETNNATSEQTEAKEENAEHKEEENGSPKKTTGKRKRVGKTVEALRKECKEKGLSTSGNKADLEKRLEQAGDAPVTKEPTAQELRKALREKGLPSTGNKADLLERLKTGVASNEESPKTPSRRSSRLSKTPTRDDEDAQEPPAKKLAIEEENNNNDESVAQA